MIEALTAPTVHVRDEAAGVCRPALVLAMPYEPTDSIRARVIRSTPIVAAIGSEDDEGEFAPSNRPTYVDTPDGPRRALDHWHRAEACHYR